MTSTWLEWKNRWLAHLYQGIMWTPTEHVVVMFDEYDNDAENKYSNVYSPSYFVQIKQQ